MKLTFVLSRGRPNYSAMGQSRSDAKRAAMTDAEVARNWDDNADRWAEQVRRGRDLYRDLYNNPAFLKFIGDLSGKTVLDAGCGEGYNTRILARSGARMSGIDLSPRMIELARDEERRERLGIRYKVASYCDLTLFADASFDAVVSFMALMDGPDFPAAMRQIFRVLKPGGMLAFSILHPCFLTKGFSWVRDESGKATALTVAHYFDDSPWVERWIFSAAQAEGVAPFAIPRFDRTMSYYLNNVLDADFILRGIAEPRPTEEACERHPGLRSWRDHVPTFFYAQAEKPK
jgi:SAM-dependent methyltransferase